MLVVSVILSFVIIFVLASLVFLVYVFFKQSISAMIKNDTTKNLNSSKCEPQNNKIAVVKCSPMKNIEHLNLAQYEKIDCKLYLSKYGKNDFCQYGCIGYGSCVRVCPESAIIIKNHTAIITESCIGCGLCTNICPQNLIELVPIHKKPFRQCNLPVGIKNQNCSASCISCEKCKSEDFLIDYCPHMCQKKTPVMLNKSFKFWQICYNILHK